MTFGQNAHERHNHSNPTLQKTTITTFKIHDDIVMDSAKAFDKYTPHNKLQNNGKDNKREKLDIA